MTLGHRSCVIAAVAAGLLALAAGCGIPTQGEARAIEDPPVALFEPLPTTTSTSLPDRDTIYRLRLYWHTDGGELVVRERIYGVSPTLSEALDELSAGPRTNELAEDPSTFYGVKFSPSVNPRQDNVENGVAYILVSDDFRAEENRRLAAAEIVCTALQFNRVDAVIIRDSQGEIPVTDINANPIEGPADASDFDNCESPPPLPPVTEGPVAEDG